jgi:hypothetical protein
MTGAAVTSKDVVIFAAADSGYTGLLTEMLASLRRFERWADTDVRVYDLGFDDADRSALAALGAQTVVPDWHFGLRDGQHPTYLKAMAARPFLRDYAPGYRRYIWLDADTWVQDPRALDHLVDGAQRSGFAIAHENDRGYRFQAWLFAWTAKHFLWGYGPLRGAWLISRPHLNNGVFCLAADAPHWDLWRGRYAAALARTGRVAPHDQFALNEIVYRDRPAVTILDSADNWICDRGPPLWDEQGRRFCKPYPPYEPLAILHLAGPAKRETYELRTLQGGSLRARLQYSWVREHLAGAAPAAGGGR